MTREQQLERALAQETEAQNKLRGEIAELRAENERLRAENERLRAAAAPPAVASVPDVKEHRPVAHKPTSPAK